MSKVKSDLVASRTRGLSGPWTIKKPRSGVLDFTCRCGYQTSIQCGSRGAPRIVAEEFDKLGHTCGEASIAPEIDRGFVTYGPGKRYGRGLS
jgi:hypothetical protein